LDSGIKTSIHIGSYTTQLTKGETKNYPQGVTRNSHNSHTARTRVRQVRPGLGAPDCWLGRR